MKPIMIVKDGVIEYIGFDYEQTVSQAGKHFYANEQKIHAKNQYLGGIRNIMRRMIINISKIDAILYQQVRKRCRLLYEKICASDDLILIQNMYEHMSKISSYNIWLEKLVFSEIKPENIQLAEKHGFLINQIDKKIILLINSFVNTDERLESGGICGLLDKLLDILKDIDVSSLSREHTDRNKQKEARESSLCCDCFIV